MSREYESLILQPLRRLIPLIMGAFLLGGLGYGVMLLDTLGPAYEDLSGLLSSVMMGFGVFYGMIFLIHFVEFIIELVGVLGRMADWYRQRGRRV